MTELLKVLDSLSNTHVTDKAIHTRLMDEGNNSVGVNHPLPTDGDSVYAKDIWVEQSNFTAFSGKVTDLFDNLHSQVVSIEKYDNPKRIIIHFNRTIVSNAIGLGNTGSGSFSNVKMYIRNSGNVDTLVVDESADNTTYTSRTYQLPITAGFNAIVIEFHVAKYISLTNCVILKAISTVARLQGVDADSMVRDVLVTQDGNLAISDKSSGLEIAKGDVYKSSVMSKFGQNDNLNTSTYEDIWDGGGIYPYPGTGTAPITHLVSTNTGDNLLIEVQGLNINGELVLQSVYLNGTTQVLLPDSPLWRIFRMKNEGSSDLVGDCNAINNGGSTIYATIQNGNNQTLMALYTIPLGYTGYLLQGTNGLIGLTRGYSISGKLLMRKYGKVFQLKKTFGLQSDGSSYLNMPFPIPGKIEARTDIRVQAISSSNGGGINTTFEINLIQD